MITIKNTKKKFDNYEALKDVSISIQKGSIYGLLGSNGAGKTTLLRLIMGIMKPDQGEITVDDQPVFENVAVKAQMFFITDALYFFSHYTILQMAHFYRGVYQTWNEERFRTLQEAFDLPLNSKIHKLSKGTQRQVAFWLALSTMPEILILDEPFDGLDPVMRKKIKNLMLHDVAEREMTVVISSHNLREIEDICDHIGIMHQGSIIIEKELDDLKSDIHKIQVAFKNGVEDSFYEGLDLLFKEKRGSISLCIVRGTEEEVVSYIQQFDPIIIDMLPLTLEEIFIYEMGDIGYAIQNIMV